MNSKVDHSFLDYLRMKQLQQFRDHMREYDKLLRTLSHRMITNFPIIKGSSYDNFTNRKLARALIACVASNWDVWCSSSLSCSKLNSKAFSVMFQQWIYIISNIVPHIYKQCFI